MTRVSLLPHRTAHDGVRASGWTARHDGAEVDVHTAPTPWELGTPIVLRSRLAVDVDRLRRVCGLAPSDELVAVARWSCAATDARGVSERVAIRDAGQAVVLSVVIDPEEALGPVTLGRAVVLGASAPVRAPATAHREGSYLWREEPARATTVELGPPRRRIGTEVADFRDLPDLDPSAAWVVDAVLGDPGAPADQALRVLLNQLHPAVIAALDEAPAAGASARSVLRWDVGRELIRRALDLDERMAADQPDGSAGQALHDLLWAVVPDRSPAELRALRDERPSALDALLQARLGLWEER